jgi:predicted nucleic acid-binding protein
MEKFDMKVYFDTNVFIEYFGKDSKNFNENWKFYAFENFSAGWNCAFKLIISDWLLKELNNHLTNDEIETILGEFRKRDKLIQITAEKKDYEKSKTYGQWRDALHAILANKAGADSLVTINIKDFYDCQDLVEILLPNLL